MRRRRNWRAAKRACRSPSWPCTGRSAGAGSRRSCKERTMMLRDWSGMREMASRLLVEATGNDLEDWNRKVETEGPSDEKLLRIWLAQRGVRGFSQSYLMVERFG